MRRWKVSRRIVLVINTKQGWGYPIDGNGGRHKDEDDHADGMRERCRQKWFDDGKTMFLRCPSFFVAGSTVLHQRCGVGSTISGQQNSCTAKGICFEVSFGVLFLWFLRKRKGKFARCPGAIWSTAAPSEALLGDSLRSCPKNKMEKGIGLSLWFLFSTEIPLNYRPAVCAGYSFLSKEKASQHHVRASTQHRRYTSRYG